MGKTSKRRKSGFAARLVRRILLLGLLLYGAALLVLAALRWIDPPSTAVQAERRIESWVTKREYRKRYRFIPLERIAPNLQRAVLTAEDGRFYSHRGFDWVEVQNAIEDEIESGRTRGASTLTQQLVKNLLLTTWRSPVRKALEYPLVPPAELILGKRRILELYLNVVEWGPGVYGAEAAAQYHFGVPAARLTREQSARLAAILPAPLRRKPARMDRYAAQILGRMAQMGW
ncbi:MAG TPA: monofunctional biosynthetic peptidoglycan transglycosylase [Bryobacteraceae bacterium]|nr:monofunctional biosynthetic peptidoglycan transglycosylase [Bryobacteraceae bacterium]